MQIAHIAIATPGRCGLYETAAELARHERMEGHAAHILDPKPTKFFPATKSGFERGVPIFKLEDRANTMHSYDLIVDHSGMDHPVTKELDKPIIYAAHGRPMSSYLTERDGGAPVMSYQYRKADDPRYKAVVTFWWQHISFLQNIWKNVPVHDITPCVDLVRWSPDGYKGYSFNGNSGEPNVVIADAWRKDVNPFFAINAFAVFAKTFTKAKLHIYGCMDRTGIEPLLQRLKESGNLGEVCGWVIGLDNIYRAADLAITPNVIATRSIREPMACGCEVVTGNDCPPEHIVSFAEVMADRIANPRDTRNIAEKMFNPSDTARKFLKVAEGVLSGGRHPQQA